MSENCLDEVLTMVRRYSNPGEVVFDGSAGTCVIAQACLLLGRVLIATDPDSLTLRCGEARALDLFIRLDNKQMLRYFLVCCFCYGHPSLSPQVGRRY